MVQARKLSGRTREEDLLDISLWIDQRKGRIWQNFVQGHTNAMKTFIVQFVGEKKKLLSLFASRQAAPLVYS